MSEGSSDAVETNPCNRMANIGGVSHPVSNQAELRTAKPATHPPEVDEAW